VAHRLLDLHLEAARKLRDEPGDVVIGLTH
jgi:hypothetical protein